MKKVLYSALAIATAIGGVAATKANSHRVSSNYFKLITGVSPTSAHALTTTTNWTFTSSPSCGIGTDAACSLGSDAAVKNVTISGVARHVPTVPTNGHIQAVANQDVPGAYLLTVDGTVVTDQKTRTL